MTAAESSCYTLINYQVENESVSEAKLKEDLGMLSDVMPS